jgi:DNA topoisomerase IA
MPTLNFVVQRFLEIKNFTSEKYWVIDMSCVISNNVLIPFVW